MLLFKLAFQSSPPPFKAIPEHFRTAFAGFPRQSCLCPGSPHQATSSCEHFSTTFAHIHLPPWTTSAGSQSSLHSPLGPLPWPRAGIKKQRDMAQRSLGRQEDYMQCVPLLGCRSRETTSLGQLGKSKSSLESS